MTFNYCDLQEVIPDMRICSMTGGETHLVLMSQEQYDALGPDSYAALCDRIDQAGLRVIMVVCRDVASAFRIFSIKETANGSCSG